MVKFKIGLLCVLLFSLTACGGLKMRGYFVQSDSSSKGSPGRLQAMEPLKIMGDNGQVALVDTNRVNTIELAPDRDSEGILLKFVNKQFLRSTQLGQISLPIKVGQTQNVPHLKHQDFDFSMQYTHSEIDQNFDLSIEGSNRVYCTTIQTVCTKKCTDFESEGSRKYQCGATGTRRYACTQTDCNNSFDGTVKFIDPISKKAQFIFLSERI